MNRFLKLVVTLVCSGVVFSFFGGLAEYIYLNTRFSVEPWHVVTLEEEFTAESIKSVPDFISYRELETRLFKELRKKVYPAGSGPGSLFNRYVSGSLSDPFEYEVNWNRSFELAVDNPRGGILMLHGLGKLAWESVMMEMETNLSRVRVIFGWVN